LNSEGFSSTFPIVRARHIILVLLSAFIVAQGVFLFIRAPHLDGLFSISFWRNIGKVGHVMLLAEDSYVSEKRSNFDVLGDNALRGLVGGLDSYSAYLSQPEFEDYSIPTRQSYAGIGAEVREIGGGVYVMGLNPSGGALEAGIRPGDRIVEIDGADVAGDGVGEIVSRLRGEPGTSVAVGVEREGEDEILRYPISRRSLTFESVRDVEILPGRIGYLSIGVFGGRTAAELEEAVNGLLGDGIDGLIIDLRNNPGGLLVAAREMVDLFVPPDIRILTVEGRREGVLESFEAVRPAIVPPDLTVVVLQNRFSASASEIFAGVLQALGRAVVVGEVSHGKGSVQSVFQLGAGDGMSLTTARYVLPDGRAIEGVGLEPDHRVEVDETDILRLSIQSNHDFGLDDREFEERFGFAPVSDEALDFALALLRTGEESGTAVGE